MRRHRTSSSIDENDTNSTCKHQKKDPIVSPASFQEFRQFTVHEYPNLSFLGPTSMAVYWFRTYLKEDWIRCNVVSEAPPRRRRNNKTKHRRKKGGNFLHIPKAYTTTGLNEKLTIQDILHIGTAGKHYANSYIGLYNMIRQYGIFSRSDNWQVHMTGYNCPDLPAQ
ncbi:unnamed protein product [Cylindrotheca closterium]|uniref:Uncharacterized protein n=1 Tax=Cylindrotheca closterium TaxID=2856 RepID=A0AAD2JJN4_9STRA|nr:unnamed protein product [Cylindrotheca closterium]